MRTTDIERYLEHLASLRRSANTIRTYGARLRQFQAHLASRGWTLEGAPRNVLQDYVDCRAAPLPQGHNDATSTLYVSVAAIRDFATWLQLDGRTHLEWSHPQFPRRTWLKKPCPDPVSVRKFLLGLDGSEEPFATLLYLLPHCGLRVHECCKLRLDELVIRSGDIDLEFVGKGGKSRVALVATEARTRMAEYLRGWRGGRGGPWLFPVPTRTDYHVTEDMVRAHMRRIQKTLKIPEMTPHRLRAYYATKLIESGVDTQTVMQLMGHSNESTLAIYVQQSPEAMRRKISRVQMT